MAKTLEAEITEIQVDEHKSYLWIKIVCSFKNFPIYVPFDLRYLDDFTRVQSIQNFTKSKDLDDLVGKQIRIIDCGDEERNSLVAIGSFSKNRFVAVSDDEFPVSEKRIYKRYGLLKES